MMKVRMMLLGVFLMAVAGGCGEGTPDSKDSRQPADLPALSLFSPDSPWNRKIGPDPAIDPNSDLMVETLVRDARNGFSIAVRQFSSPVYVVDAGTPRHDIEIRCGGEWGVGVRRMKNVPIPDWAEPAASEGTVNPDGCGEGDNEGDYTMVVIDPATRCEYDFWQIKNTAVGWTASWGNAISIDSDGIFPKGMSARGSGFAFTAGMIWPEELRRGRIEHALAFNSSSVKAGGPVAPATDSDGESTRRGAIPEGTRVQLDPVLDLDNLNLTEYERTIARALQEYGMFLVDSGGPHGGMSLYAVDPKSVAGNPYQGILPDEDYVSIANIPADRFRILKLPSQVPDTELALVPNACARWE